MRAWAVENGTVRVDAGAAEPKPAAGEALIRPTRLAIGSADLTRVRGGGAGVPGQAFVGVVEAVGKGTDTAWVGRRVVGEVGVVCGACDLCRAGLKAHCRQRGELGTPGRDGCFAERFTLPAANLHAVPDNVDDDRAVFAEPLAAAYQIMRQLTIEGRPYLTVLGDGRLGLLCAQVLSKLNATVRCIGRHEAKLALCEKWGVKHRLLRDVGLRQDQDIVVDCTGRADGLATAVAMVRPRGTVVLKTIDAPPGEAGARGSALSALVANEINVVGSRRGPVAAALEALSADEVDVVSLISRRMKLADGAAALETAAKPGVLYVLMDA
jgi:threonine dehydrogenase-like Zn-dependent dehydrogenase